MARGTVNFPLLFLELQCGITTFFNFVRVLVNFPLLCLEKNEVPSWNLIFDLQAPGNLDQQDCWFVFTSAQC